jgi:drug/metabolite transporter (DMT)-like permease
MIGMVVAVVCILRIFVHLSRAMRSETAHEWAAVACTAILAAVVGQSLGAAHLFGSPYVYPMVPVILAVAWSFGRGSRDRERRADG